MGIRHSTFSYHLTSAERRDDIGLLGHRDLRPNRTGCGVHADPVGFPRGQTTVDLLRHHARVHGNELVFGFLDTETRLAESLSYRSLLRRATGFAHLLLELDLRGKTALLAFPHGPEFIVAFFAAHIMGVVPVPVKLPRRREEAAVLSRVARDAEAAAVLVSGRHQQAIMQRLAADRGLARLPVIAEEADGGDPGEIQVPVQAGDLALLQYTSGSTSDPKGVEITHANLIANSEMIRTGFGNDRTTISVSWLPMYHDMGLIGGVLEPLYVGFPGYFLNPVAVLQQPSRWLTAISRWRATVSGGPNFGYELCVQRPPREDSGPLDLSSWRVACNGAEPVLATTIERFCSRFAAAGFSPRAFYPCYGLAEATLMVTGGQPSDAVRTMSIDAEQLAYGRVAGRQNGASARRLVGCGGPLPGTELAIVDPVTGRQAAAGRVGEIWVAGPGVAAGYRNRQAESAHTFRALQADQPGMTFLRTGDVGFVADGQLFVVGRLRDKIDVRGRNLYPEDIELTVIGACASWEATGCAVFAADGPAAMGIVVAVELPRRAGDVPVREVAARVREQVSTAHGVAVRDVVAVGRWHLPRTSSGKVRRSECARRYMSGALSNPSAPDETGP